MGLDLERRGIFYLLKSVLFAAVYIDSEQMKKKDGARVDG